MKVVLLGWTTSPRLGSDSDRETDLTTLKYATVILKTSDYFLQLNTVETNFYVITWLI